MWLDFLSQHTWQFVAMASMLVCSGFISGSETALFNLSRGQLYKLKHRGPTGQIVTSLMSNPQRTLNALLLANLIVNVAYTALAATLLLDAAASDLAGWVAPAGSIAGLLVLILVGEVTPKMIAMALAEKWAILAGPVLVILVRALGPVLWLLHHAAVDPITRLLTVQDQSARDISADELSAMFDLSASRGAIDHDTNAMLNEIVDLAGLRTGDIMVPRIDIIAHDVKDPPAMLLELFRKTGLRKIPVYDGDIDHIVGIVHVRRMLLTPESPIADMASAPTFVPEGATVERLLVDLRSHKAQTALVVDEYGGIAGLVTLEDVLAEIVGDMPDPKAAERGPEVERIGTGEYLLDGDMPIHEWVDAFRIHLSHKRISTIGGFVISILGHMPHIDDEVGYRNLRFTVSSLRGRRIGKLHLHVGGES